MANHKIRFLSAADIHKSISMAEAVETMKEAFALLSGKRAIVPNRMHMETAAHNGVTLFMPSYIPKIRKIGLKVVSVFDDNQSKNLPAINALVMLIDATNGMPLAILEGATITSLRTGAVSGAATDLLAREDAKSVAIFGAGVQAETQLEAVCAVRKIESVLVFGRNPQRTETFIAKMQKKLSMPIAVGASTKQLAEMDIICTATNAAAPLFSDEDIQPGVHINAIGVYKPDMREVPGETVARSKVVVDEVEACMLEAGDILIPMYQGLFNETHIHAELGEIVSGQKAGRKSPGEITFFKSVGNAIQDLAVGEKILASAEKAGLGTEVSM